MRILLINPGYRMSFWTLTGAMPITHRPGFMCNLALPTLAALAPPDVDVQIIDDGVEPVDFDTPCDLVGITGYITQRARMFEIADAFRARGVPVAIGGPYASLSPAVVRPHADILFRGEAEDTWPAFLDDFRRGEWDAEYAQADDVDIKTSPAPQVELLRNDQYYMGAIQTSRGCPFECEFCDVIVYLGRRQRHKAPDQVVEEVERLHRAGYRQVFLADDNFTAHRRKSAEILRAIADWNAQQEERVSFLTQLSIDVARDSDEPLLDLCVEAGLSIAFVGIETPNEDALREVKKFQNVRYDLLTSVKRMQGHGIALQAGMIVGFDSDTTKVFASQYEFAQEAAITMVSLGMLNAPEGTPLETRLRLENRLRPTLMDDVYLSTNMLPKLMSTAELETGTRWLMNKLYAPEAFTERLDGLAHQLPQMRPVGGRFNRESANVWGRLCYGYRSLGPEFEQLPRHATQMFRDRNFSHAIACLIFYYHVIQMLQTWQVWDPELARAEAPRW